MPTTPDNKKEENKCGACGSSSPESHKYPCVPKKNPYVIDEDHSIKFPPDNKRIICCENCTTINYKGNIERTLGCLDSSCPCHKRELSQCCGKEKVANYADEGTGCYLCQGCLGEFIPRSPDNFSEKTLAEFERFYLQAMGVSGPIRLKAIKDFLRSALNAQREEAYKEGLEKRFFGDSDDHRDWKIKWQKEAVAIYQSSLLEQIEGIQKSMKYKAMVENGDLSFGNYMPTEIYNKALSDTINLIKEGIE